MHRNTSSWQILSSPFPVDLTSFGLSKTKTQFRFSIEQPSLSLYGSGAFDFPLTTSISAFSEGEMSMIASSSHSDPDSRSLQILLEAFGSRFSLDDIAAAYCQASQNVDVAGEILFAMTEKTPQSNTVKTKGAMSKPTHVDVPKEVRPQEDSKAKVWMPKKGSTSVGTTSSDIGNVNVNEKLPQIDKAKMKGPTLSPTHVDGRRQEDSKSKVWKQKKGSTSIGTVTSVIGKEYVRTRPLVNAPREATKPMKIDSKEVPETEIWGEELPESNEANTSRVPTDVEEFIVNMLGEGFQFSQDVIHEVLGLCGYDVKKSTEKLLDLSETKKYADVGTSNEITSKVDPQGQGSTSRNQLEQQQELSQSDGARSFTGSQEGGKDKSGLEKEVLEALFSGVEKYDEVPKITRRFGERRARVAGRPVFKPLEDPFQERVVAVKQSSQTSKEDEDDENEFKAHRKAAHEHWHGMKEYYGAAVKAFEEGDTERARRLVEQGHFFGQKAREADDKSIAKMLGAKKNDDSTCKEDEVVTVNVNEHEPKEAVRFLKRQLLYFSGIASAFKYLKVKLGDNKEDSKCKRRHNAIAKLLEGESIVWSEEDNGTVMMIRVDEIDPKKLSFAKK